MKTQFGLVLLGLLFGVSPALAQTPVAALPQGRPIAGWAVEVIPGDDRRPAEEFMGVRGLGRFSAPLDLISFKQLAEQAGVREPTVHNGRAYLKITAEGTHSFAIQIRRTGGMYVSCEGALTVGGKKVLSGKVTPQDGFATILGNVNLAPGYYAVEYVARCDQYNHNMSAYRIMYRGASDGSLRSLDDGELVYFQQ